jgi:bacterioferritin-associated ferredoxin
MDQVNKKGKRDRLVCLCNGVPQSKIEEAIKRGCNSLGKLFDATLAGVGACGGSCQPNLKKMLDEYAKHGTFPENQPAPSRRRQSRS